MSRIRKTAEQLDDEALKSMVTSFITVQAADWRRRQLNRVLPALFHAVDEARASGDAVDVQALLKQIWLDRELPVPEIG